MFLFGISIILLSNTCNFVNENIVHVFVLENEILEDNQVQVIPIMNLFSRKSLHFDCGFNGMQLSHDNVEACRHQIWRESLFRRVKKVRADQPVVHLGLLGWNEDGKISLEYIWIERFKVVFSPTTFWSSEFKKCFIRHNCFLRFLNLSGRIVDLVQLET